MLLLADVWLGIIGKSKCGWTVVNRSHLISLNVKCLVKCVSGWAALKVQSQSGSAPIKATQTCFRSMKTVWLWSYSWTRRYTVDLKMLLCSPGPRPPSSPSLALQQIRTRRLCHVGTSPTPLRRISNILWHDFDACGTIVPCPSASRSWSHAPSTRPLTLRAFPPAWF